MIARPAPIESFETPHGGSFALRRFRPVGEFRGSVVLLHGIISHAGWYTASADYLASQGFDVLALDRRGSGLNTESRGDIEHWQTWVRDVVAVCESQRRLGPVVLLGISWGGKLAPAVARARPDLLAGMGLICPGQYAHQQPGLLKRGALAATGVVGVHEKRVEIPLQDPALFTNSPIWQQYIRNDPLTLRHITLRFAREDHKLTRYSRRSGPFVTTPSLLVLAGRDRMIKNPRTRRYLATFAAGDKVVLEYQSAAHTLEFEPEPELFFEDLTGWVSRVVKRQA
ncbi:alpha/beta fold hydrolase [Aeoliella mucimassa]|uniref:Phospholipase YtpA n=1 Tax=Aeoliella mucimassa TaxID=2527972 RepID=A0A518ATI5_9BACT|nr:alpha/beta fold hydrolase [Aeoliella mucimassa]QDU58039.1 Phospholipase YtpA [Aeoliella mucimassa]